jgi:hypothetical protein
MCLWAIFRISFSNNLLVVSKRLIGHKFWRHVRSLPGFGKIIIFCPTKASESGRSEEKN